MVLTYKLLNFKEEVPRSDPPETIGIREVPEASLPVKVIVSVIASPMVLLPFKLVLPVTVKVPEMAVAALLMVAVPVEAPKETVVAAPPIFKVVAVALTKLKVVAVVVISPPLTARSPVSVVFPVTARVEERVVAPVTVRVPEIEGEDFRLKVTDEPSDTSPPSARLVPAVTVTLELLKAELGILVKVLADPERDLLVKVSVVVLPTRVSVISGRVIILAAVGVQVKVPLALKMS